MRFNNIRKIISFNSVSCIMKKINSPLSNTNVNTKKDFRDSDFSGQRFTNPHCFNNKSVDFTNSILKDANLSEINLNDSNFTNTTLINTFFKGANLRNANFSKLKVVRNVDFSDANLHGANLIALPKCTIFINAQIDDNTELPIWLTEEQLAIKGARYLGDDSEKRKRISLLSKKYSEEKKLKDEENDKRFLKQEGKEFGIQAGRGNILGRGRGQQFPS